MRNVTMKVTGDTLTITVNLKKTFGPTKSGKSITIASTDGNTEVEGRPEVKVGLNVYTPVS